MKTILVTGGTGYIGSHTVVELLNSGYSVVIVDNLSNSSMLVLDRIATLTGGIKPDFYNIDIRARDALRKVFEAHQIDAIIHFAASKAVGESVVKPLMYYDNNVAGTIALLEVVSEFNVNNFIFSSSATVYGNPKSSPISEDFPLQATSPYGATKIMMEQILQDLAHANTNFCVALLRYFNPVGAHKSGLIGENPKGIPNNLMPYIAQVAVGRLTSLQVFGHDYPTVDGTGVRDYIHVVDLAHGHIKALEYFLKPHAKQVLIANLGTGVGFSVLDVVKAFEKASGKTIQYKMMPRRSGDVATCYANPGLANRELNWHAQYDIDVMCTDTWNWQTKNPNGYEK